MKNGKYIQYSRIFHTFARVKTLAESPCPIMRCSLRTDNLYNILSFHFSLFLWIRSSAAVPAPIYTIQNSP